MFLKICSVSWRHPKYVAALFILTYLDIILLNSTSQHFSNPNLRYPLNRLLELHAFLEAFAKLRKGTTSFVMSLRPSVRQHGTTQFPNGRIFTKFCI